MKVVITGGRHYGDKPAELQHIRLKLAWLFYDLLKGDPNQLQIAHGATPTKAGVDWIADGWARQQGIDVEMFAVDTQYDGEWPAAGPRRNQRMLDTFQPDLVAAFPGGNGTKSCVDAASLRGIPVIKIPKPKGGV